MMSAPQEDEPVDVFTAVHATRRLLGDLRNRIRHTGTDDDEDLILRIDALQSALRRLTGEEE